MGFWWLRSLGRWLPGGKRPYLLGGGQSRLLGRKRKGQRGAFDYGPGKNALIRLGCYGTALLMFLLLFTVKLVTGQ